MSQQIVATFLVGLSLGLPSYAAAGVTATSTPDPLKQTWIQRIADAQHARDEANARYSAALREYGNMRHRRRARGDKKAEILAEQETARVAAESAERGLEETLEAARRAGVPPGWVREALAKNAAPAEQAH